MSCGDAGRGTSKSYRPPAAVVAPGEKALQSGYVPRSSPIDIFADVRDRNRQKARPLAARMRPRTVEEFVGQEHFFGPGKLLRRMLQADRLSSLIFFGPPGTGKTALAHVIARHTRC